MSDDALVIEGVTKHFRKRTVRREYTTLKTELLRWLKRERPAVEPLAYIEALKGVNLRVGHAKTVGIIGRNGSGKSTLLKCVTGIYTPTSGTVKVHGRISALLELGAGFHPDFTGRENILINGIILGMSRAEVKSRVEQIVSFAELGDFIDEPVRTYSSGMYTRLAFAVATHVDPDVLIIDELLSVGDEHFQRKSFARMQEIRRRGTTILLVTHDLATVERWCDEAAWIDGGVIRAVGNPAQVVSDYRAAVAAAEAEAVATGSSALSAPGLPLPMGASTVAHSPVLVQALELLDGAGAPARALGADETLQVVTGYDVKEATEAGFHLDLVGPGGQTVFSSKLEPGRLEVGQGSARLRLERLALGPGDYRVQVRAVVAGSVASSAEATLPVPPRDGAAGLLRVPHHWELVRPGTAA